MCYLLNESILEVHGRKKACDKNLYHCKNDIESKTFKKKPLSRKLDAKEKVGKQIVNVRLVRTNWVKSKKTIYEVIK